MDCGTFVEWEHSTVPHRVGIILGAHRRVAEVLWLNDYSFDDIHFSQLSEVQKPSANPGIPKLPPLGEFESWCRNNSIHISVCKPIYEWFGRQLQK